MTAEVPGGLDRLTGEVDAPLLSGVSGSLRPWRGIVLRRLLGPHRA
jgi:hypothetical protein